MTTGLIKIAGDLEDQNLPEQKKRLKAFDSSSLKLSNKIYYKYPKFLGERIR